MTQSLTDYQCLTIRGVELDCEIEFEANWVDDSFDHEFGTEACGHIEVGEVEWIVLDCGRMPPYDVIMEAIKNQGRFLGLSRKKWLRQSRRLALQIIQDLDHGKIDLDENELQQAAEQADWTHDEPDYDDDRDLD